MFKRNPSQIFIACLVSASLAACGGGGDSGLPGAPGLGSNQTTSSENSQNSQAAAELFVLFVILIAKQIINDEDGMEPATRSSGLASLYGITSNDGFALKQVPVEKVTTDLAKLCSQPKLILSLIGVSGCSGSLILDSSFAGNVESAGAYTNFNFNNLSITTLSPAETSVINGSLRMDFLALTVLSPLTGKVKLTSSNLTSSSSLSAAQVKPQNFELNATFSNGNVTSYENVKDAYSVSNLSLVKDSTATTISNATIRSLFNGASVDTVLSNVRVADKLATFKIEVPLTATVTGTNNTKAEINLMSSGPSDTAVGTVQITDVNGAKTYNVSVPK
jgi:hypothetical protein